MAEAVDRGDEIIFGFACGVLLDDGLQHCVVGIGKEHRLDVGVAHPHVLHTVFFLVATGQFVFLYNAVQIVVNVCSHDKSILGFAVHRLGIDVIVVVCVLHKPSFLLKHCEVFCRLVIDARVVFACSRFEVNLRLYYMVQTLLVVTGLSAGFFRVEHVVRTRFHLLYKVLGRTQAFEWFNGCHIVWGLLVYLELGVARCEE